MVRTLRPASADAWIAIRPPSRLRRSARKPSCRCGRDRCRGALDRWSSLAWRTPWQLSDQRRLGARGCCNAHAPLSLPAMGKALPRATMEARQVDELPRDKGWQFEPKWDGFRCLASRDGAKVELMGRSGKSLARYFPEIVAALARLAGPALHLRRRARHPGRQGAVVRCAADAPASRREPHRQARRRDTGAVDRVRLPADARRRSHRAAIDRTARSTGEASFVRLADGAASAPVARDHAAGRGLALAGAGRRRRARWCRRQAPRRALSRGRAGDAQDQVPAHGRLRRRRLPLCHRSQGGRLTAARPLRRPGPARSCRLHLGDLRCRAAGPDAQARQAARRAGLHRRRAGRSQPLVDRTQQPMGAARAQAGRRGAVRSRHRASAFATARASCAGAPTSCRKQCTMDQLQREAGRRA